MGKIFDWYRARQPIGWQRDDVRFHFDNEEIDEDETPADLGMEDQDEIETSFDNEEILEDETPADLGMEDQDEIVCKVLEVTKDHC